MNTPQNDPKLPERPDRSDPQPQTGSTEPGVDSFFAYDAANSGPLRPTVTFFEYDAPPARHRTK